MSKPVRQSIDKLKQDEKIDGWKRTFIVYQSRLEKRKSWKEKTKLLKELEDKLAFDKNELENEKEKDEQVDKEEQEGVSENLKTDEPKQAKLTRKQIDELIKKDDKYNRSKREVKFSDSESDDEDDEQDDEGDEYEDDDEDEEMEQDSESNNEEENIIENNKKRLLSSDKSDDEESDSEQDETEDVDLKSTYVFSEANLKKEKDETKPEKELKPLIISQKPAYMEIKQLNLDQLKGADEIPIDSKSELVDEETEQNMNEQEENITTIKLSEDPFFLDSSGNEINNPRIENENSRFYERSKMFNRTYNELDNDNLMSYSSYDRYKSKKRDMYQSSFKTSLSDSRTRNNYHGSSDFKNRDRFNNNDRKTNNFNDNNRFDRNSNNFRQRGKFISF